jgi:drug/metabolite transporter (DMT)-like permease
MRIGFGAMALCLLPASRKPVAARDWPVIAVLGVVWMALPFLLFSYAERTVPTAIAGMINGAVPLVTAAVAALSMRRMPSARRTGALLLGLAGVSIIAFSPAHDPSVTTDMTGVVMLLVGIVGYGVSNNLARPLQQRYGALPVLFRVQLVGLVASIPYGLVAARTATFSWVGLGAMFLLGALGTGFAYVISLNLMGRTDATRGSVGVFLAVLVLAGAVFTSLPERR